MRLRGELPGKVPLFPLPGALLLPRAKLPLQIFEPRYLAMLEDTLKTPDRLIGMIQPRPRPDGTDALAAIGCAGRVTAFSETEDGRYLITLTGISRFRLASEISGFAPYLSGEVRWEDFTRDREWNDGAAKAQLFTIFDALKPNDPVVQKGRRKLSSMIFA